MPRWPPDLLIQDDVSNVRSKMVEGWKMYMEAIPNSTSPKEHWVNRQLDLHIYITHVCTVYHVLWDPLQPGWSFGRQPTSLDMPTLGKGGYANSSYCWGVNPANSPVEGHSWSHYFLGFHTSQVVRQISAINSTFEISDSYSNGRKRAIWSLWVSKYPHLRIHKLPER